MNRISIQCLSGLIALLIALLAQSNLFNQALNSQSSHEWLAERFEQALNELHRGEGRISICIRDLELPLTLYERNPDTVVNPGSIQKLITAAAALKTLGPNYRFATELEIVEPDFTNHTARALIVRGSGDPHYPRLISVPRSC